MQLLGKTRKGNNNWVNTHLALMLKILFPGTNLGKMCFLYLTCSFVRVPCVLVPGYVKLEFSGKFTVAPCKYSLIKI